MVAGEAIYPRVTIKEAFKTVYWRFAIFFIGGGNYLSKYPKMEKLNTKIYHQPSVSVSSSPTTTQRSVHS
jgi:amino acid permease